MTIKPSDLKSIEILQDLEQRKAKEIDMSFLSHQAEDHSLSTKLLKLCSNLRQGGFDVYANSLEQKLLNLKLAEKHLYNTTEETGEDLIDFAHPEGDHQIAPSSNKHGDIETIISQQKKDIEIVNKKPTGKLANKILQQILIVLGQEDPKQKIVNLLQQALDLSIKANNFNPSGDEYMAVKNYIDIINQKLDLSDFHSIDSALQLIKSIKPNFEPGVLKFKSEYIDNDEILKKVIGLVNTAMGEMEKTKLELTNKAIKPAEEGSSINKLPEFTNFDANNILKSLTKIRDFYMQVINNTEILMPLKGNDRALEFFEELYDTLEHQAIQFNNAAKELAKLDLNAKLSPEQVQRYLSITPLANKNFKSNEELSASVQKAMNFVKDQFKKANLNLVG